MPSVIWKLTLKRVKLSRISEQNKHAKRSNGTAGNYADLIFENQSIQKIQRSQNDKYQSYNFFHIKDSGVGFQDLAQLGSLTPQNSEISMHSEKPTQVVDSVPRGVEKVN